MELSMRNRKALMGVVARRYRKASRSVKGETLNEFVASTGYNRSYAAMLLRGYAHNRVVSGAGGAVEIRTSLPQIASHPELRISAAVQLKLSHISAATVDRLLATARKRLFLKGVQHTKPAAALAAQIPIRTFGE